jgi:hypothetical protein
MNMQVFGGTSGSDSQTTSVTVHRPPPRLMSDGVLTASFLSIARAKEEAAKMAATF